MLHWLRIGIYFVLGIAAGIAIGSLLKGQAIDFDIGFSLIFVLCVFLWFVPSIWLHEFGHYLFGRLAGLQFMFMLVGSRLLVSRDGELERSRIAGRAFAGGLTGMVPPPVYTLSRSRFGLFIAGGIILNFLAAVAAGLVWLSLRSFSLDWPVVNAVLLALVVVSVLFILLAGLPHHGGGFPSDGRRLLNLIHNPQIARADQAMLTLSGMAMSGPRPREWPPGLLDDLSVIEPQSYLGVTANLLCLYHAYDSANTVEARRLLQLVEDGLPQVPEKLLGNFDRELALFDLLLNEALDSAQQRLQRKREVLLAEDYEDDLLKFCLSAVQGAADKSRLAEAGRGSKRSLTPAMAAAKVAWVTDWYRRRQDAATPVVKTPD